MTELRPELWLPGGVHPSHGPGSAGPDPRELELAWTCYPGATSLPSRLGDISLEPPIPGPPPMLEEPWRLELASAEGQVTVLAEKRFFQTLLSQLPEQPSLDALEEGEAILVAEYAAIDLIEAAEQFAGVPLLPQRLSAAAALAAPHWRLWMRASLPDGQSEFLQIGMPARFAAKLMRKLIEPQASEPRLAGLPVEPGTARLFIGILDLPAEEISGLSAEDIILIEGCRDNIIAGVFVCEDGTSWPVDVLGATAVVTGLPGETRRLPMHGSMPDLSSLEPAPAEGMARVAFEFGSFDYSPRSLRLVFNGDSLPVTRMAQGLVRIYAGRQPIGRGRVVHVEGGIGVKIESQE